MIYITFIKIATYFYWRYRFTKRRSGKDLSFTDPLPNGHKDKPKLMRSWDPGTSPSLPLRCRSQSYTML